MKFLRDVCYNYFIHSVTSYRYFPLFLACLPVFLLVLHSAFHQIFSQHLSINHKSFSLPSYQSFSTEINAPISFIIAEQQTMPNMMAKKNKRFMVLTNSGVWAGRGWAIPLLFVASAKWFSAGRWAGQEVPKPLHSTSKTRG